LKATATLGWRHAFGNAVPRSTLAFASGGETFTVAGLPIAKNAAVIDAGLEIAIGKNATLALSYNGQHGTGITDNGVRAGFRLGF
ncbi:MAG: autotransporter domain-containing protein, partial [Novosphingobium sp.]|nr:autotransporter domain-containing protein [Novosphingobium sp.]